jgi:prepilin-type N-terminal cleavage/methylation domain-containing protein
MIMEKVSRRLEGQGGFTLIELSMYVIILGIILSVSVLSYYNIMAVNTLGNAQRQIKAALQRAYNIAQNENVKATLKIYGKNNASYPNSYTYLRGDDRDDENVSSWDYQPELPLPTMGAGSSQLTGNGFYIFKLLDGMSGLEIQSDATIVFNPRGTVIRVEDASGNPSSFTINVSYRGHSGTVTVNSSGEVSM